MIRSIKIKDICEKLGLSYEGEDITIDGLGLCNRQCEHSSVLSYITAEDYIKTADQNASVAALVVSPELKEKCLEFKIRIKNFIVTDEPEKTFYDIHEYLYSQTDFYDKYDFDTVIGANADIAPSAVIERGVIIGDNVTIGHNSVVRRGTVIDDNVSIGCNSTIGAEGFQVIKQPGMPPYHVKHVGGVHIHKNAYISDNTCVCNTLFEGKTYIGENAHIDNLVHIGHNGHIGDDSVITAGVILCGSVYIGNDAWIAPNSSIANRVDIGDGATVWLGSVVTRDVPPNSLAYGVPAKCKS